MRRARRQPATSPEIRLQQRLSAAEGKPPAWRGDDGWHLIGGAGEPAFVGGWSNSGGAVQACRFRRDQTGTVYIEGNMVGSSLTTAWTLPAGYRPAAQLYFPTNANGAFGAFQVTAAGAVTPIVGAVSSFSLTCNFKASG